ncbi:MAG: efflux transporter periplasmic adaptor subunit, partial [Chromatiaceae bacterium]|nr:efflux transporter periplasmic adaptor subunit [Chromatiaceae bacterium]
METSTLAARGPTAPVRPWPLALASCALALLILLPGCKPADAPDAAPEPIRPVRVVTVEERPGGEAVTLTGTVQAQEDVALAFRIGG